MIFKSLIIKKGLFSKEFFFESNVNLIFSKKNSVGKTTLLRILMYSLGYAIPSTKGINFSKFELTLTLVDTSGTSCKLTRIGDYITLHKNYVDISYSLPYDMNELHSSIFAIKNKDLINNLIGVYYVDQEKGWTLLNRGIVIGNNHFSIESFILGLSNRSCDNLTDELFAVKVELQKYKHMFDTAQYQKQINELNENISYDSEFEELSRRLDILYFERNPIDNELKRIENVLKKNTTFKKFISSMKLYVKTDDGKSIPVNEDTLEGFAENMEFLISKRKSMFKELVTIDNKIKEIENKLHKDEILFDVKTLTQSFDSDISKIHIDSRAVENVIKKLEKERKTLENQISNAIKRDNPIVSELHMLISRYALELGVDEAYVKANKDYIFTSDLKSLSGTIFHKIVFAFKLAYIKIVSIHTGELLPIILDSPSGREVDKINVEEMMKLLNKYFNSHQIIIASIYSYNFTNVNVIELNERLLY